MNLNLMILTADPQFAIEAQEAGIERIFFDLEYLNKVERQRGRNTVISNNNIDDIPKVRAVLTTSKLLVRTNPLHAYSEGEVNKAIEYGADILMLPMVISPSEVKQYVDFVAGRTMVCIMIETAQAMARIDDILDIEGVDEIFIGLNDLHISLGLNFMFEVLSGGLVDYMAAKCRAKNIPFGFGGIARIGDGTLPAEKILGEHIRLQSTSVILSRTFKGEVGENSNVHIYIKDEVQKVRGKLMIMDNWSASDFSNNKSEVRSIVNSIIAKYV